MRSIEARKILNRHCELHEEWHCGQVAIRFTRKDPYPRVDRRIQIFLNQSPEGVEVKKVSRLLDLLDRLGRKKEFDMTIGP